jgi:hypothetical protein
VPIESAAARPRFEPQFAWGLVNIADPKNYGHADPLDEEDA